MDNSLLLPGVLTGALLLGLVASLGVMVIAPMLADAPGSEKLISVQVAVYALFSLPVMVGVALVGVWVCYFLGLAPTALCLVSLLPLVNIGVFAVAFAGVGRGRS